MLSVPLSPVERAVVVLDAVLGVALCAVAGMLIAAGLGAQADPGAPHGGAFELLGALLAGPPGVLFLVVAVGVARRWRWRWWLHALPPLAPAVLLALGDAGLLR